MEEEFVVVRKDGTVQKKKAKLFIKDFLSQIKLSFSPLLRSETFKGH